MSDFPVARMREIKCPNVNLDVCQVLLSEYLEGFQGYPRTEPGVRRFAVALQQNCVSVGHVRAVLKTFDEAFPTVRQIHDIAFNLRQQFEPSESDLRAEWERKYGSPNGFTCPADRVGLHWQAMRDMLFYTEGPGQYELRGLGPKHERAHDAAYWEESRQRKLESHTDSIAFIRRMVDSYGWPAVRGMEAPPEPMPYTNPQRPVRHFANVGAPITQADIKRAQAERRKTTAQVDREMDSDA